MRKSRLKQHNHTTELSDTASHPSMRRCIVSGQSYPRETLLRFVAAPDGTLVFDVKRQLPGRGVWVYPDSDLLAQAIAKNLFARGAKQAVKVGEDLPQKVEMALQQRVLNLMQRALQSREMVNGFEKVASALRAGETRLLIHASDAAEDGVSKLNKLCEESVEILQPFSRDEMAQVLGIANPVHLSVKSSGLAKAIADSYKVWAGFLKKDAL